MASADILQYQPQSSAYNNYSLDRDPPPSSALLHNFFSPTKSTTSPQWPSSPTKNAISTRIDPPPGTVVAANVVSNHGKLHKRAVHKNSRGKLKTETDSDIVLTRTKTPPLTSTASPIEVQRSPAKSITRDLFKQNLRKLSSHRDEGNNQVDTIDLSRTAEENEERSGLGITTSNGGSKSQSDLRFPVGTSYRGHTRSQSHNSVISNSSGIYQPSVLFVQPIRDTSLAYPPTMTRPRSENDQAGNTYFGYGQEGQMRSRGATLTSTSSTGEKPRLKLNTSASFARLANSSQSAFSITGSPVRTRRCTNQSTQSVEAATLKSKASADRAFTFHSKNKEEPVDSATRAANIQAARQAFEDRQEAKAKKYDEQEQKALDRQNRKQAKHEDRKRRQSDATRTSVRAVSVPRSEKFESGGEYEASEPRPGHPLRDEIAVEAETGPGSAEKQRISKKRAVKSRYIRFLTWLKTKFLNMGRSRRAQ